MHAFDVLGDPVRRRILELLADGEHASGEVVVQVLLDEKGKVVKASALSGHPLLRSAAEQAARQAEFSPWWLGGQPVKVSGVITYSFVP